MVAANNDIQGSIKEHRGELIMLINFYLKIIMFCFCRLIKIGHINGDNIIYFFGSMVTELSKKTGIKPIIKIQANETKQNKDLNDYSNYHVQILTTNRSASHGCFNA